MSSRWHVELGSEGAAGASPPPEFTILGRAVTGSHLRSLWLRGERIVPRPMPTRAEAELLARWRAGDDAAGREVCERHGELVARIAAAYRPRECSAEDLVQEVFLTMFARSERYQPRDGAPFEHWLARLAVNVCRDRLRGEARGPRRVELSQGGERALEWLAGGRDDAHHDASAAREAVDALLTQLPAEDRLVLTLLDLEGRSTAQIAELTGWSRALVKVRAFRARIRLRSVAKRLEERGR